MMKKTVCLLFMCLLLVGALAGCDTIDKIGALDSLKGLFHTHTPAVDAAVAPTCTENGLTEGSHCADCGKILTAQEILPAAHTAVVDAAVAPTCIATGLTEGSRCAACGEILTPQSPLPVERVHVIVSGTCIDCGAKESTPGLSYRLTEDKKSYVLIGIGECTESEIYIGLHKGLDVVAIDDSAFFKCESITSVVIGDTVTEIGRYAFRLCTNLSYIDIPDSVTEIGSTAFLGCDKLLKGEDGLLYVDKWLAWVENDEVPFIVTLRPDTVGIVLDALSYASDIKAFRVADDAEHFCAIDGNLYSKDGKTLVSYAKGKEDTAFTVPAHVTAIAPDAFEEADRLAMLTFAEGSVCESIGYGAFMGCSSLATVIFPNALQRIDDCAFYGCEQLSIAFLSNDSACRSIGDEAFYECRALSEFFVPQTVEYMGERVFFDCADITVTAEHSEQPSGWHPNWAAGCNVVWGSVG